MHLRKGFGCYWSNFCAATAGGRIPGASRCALPESSFATSCSYCFRRV